jgi:hypothetical protein
VLCRRDENEEEKEENGVEEDDGEFCGTKFRKMLNSHWS